MVSMFAFFMENAITETPECRNVIKKDVEDARLSFVNPKRAHFRRRIKEITVENIILIQMSNAV